MKNFLSDLHPSRVVARRVYELETELQRARMHLRRHRKSPDTLGRWGLEQPSAPAQEEGWFLTYLDMMTLLLVVMIVMLAFSGRLNETLKLRANLSPTAVAAQHEATPPKPEAEGGHPTHTAAAPTPAGPSPSSAEVAAIAPDAATTSTASAHPVEAGSDAAPSPGTAEGPHSPPGNFAETMQAVQASGHPADAEVPATTHAEQVAAASASIAETATGSKTGTGLLPGGSGLFPGNSPYPDTGAISEPYPGWVPGASALPPDATIVRGLPPIPLPPATSLEEMYPGWGASDLAAAFVGPPVPPHLRTEPSEPDAATAVASAPPQGAAGPDGHVAAAAKPAGDAEPPSEGETLAAGLSLGELGNDVEVIVRERSVSFRVNSEILFDSSQADLSRSGLGVLRRIVQVLANTNHSVTVEGHTDSVPVRRNVRYPSNWELSSARAGSVVRYLQANGIRGDRLKAIGYADTRPIADNHTPDGRARNRRVELVIEKQN